MLVAAWVMVSVSPTVSLSSPTETVIHCGASQSLAVKVSGVGLTVTSATLSEPRLTVSAIVTGAVGSEPSSSV